MNPEFRADLHCHSTCSDGSDSPMDLVKKAKLANLHGLSITDHDSIEAYTPELFSLAKELGVRLLSGVELSSELKNITVHVLGYGFDLQSESLLSFLREMQQRRNDRNREILEKLRGRKIMVFEEEVLSLFPEEKKSIGRPHIAALMIKKGYVNSLKDAFELYLKEGGSCYVPGFKFTPGDAIHQIHQAKGKAVLAHPHFIHPKSVKALLELPFDGLECHYGTLHKHKEAPWLKIAKGKGWIATGGSDYHGVFKPHISLGCSWVNEAIFDQLISP